MLLTNKPDGYVVLEGVLPHENRLPQGAHERGLHGDEELRIADSDVLGHIPCEVHHRHDRLIPLGLVPLVPLGRRLAKNASFVLNI